MEWLIILAWGGLVGLDATSFPQVMISRPLPAAVLLGIALGDPVAGAVIGGFLEAYSLATLPIGAARYPESGTAAVAAAGAYMMVAGPELSAALVLLAVLFALGWERLSGASVGLLRRLNERVAAAPPEPAGTDPAWVVRRHVLALGIDFVRAALVTLVGWALALVLLVGLGADWTLAPGPTLGALTIAATALLGASLALFGGWQERRLVFVLGLLCGMGVLWAT